MRSLRTGLDMAGNVVANVGAPVAPTDAATRAYVDAAAPIGAILAYGGSTAPPGWHLCDGSAHGSTALQAVLGSPNTPNLRDRFVMGAGSANAPGATGGQNFVTLDVGQIPSHTHAPYSAAYFAISAGGTTGFHAGGTSGGKVATTLATGGGGAHENRPPYYALTYIIKKV